MRKAGVKTGKAVKTDKQIQVQKRSSKQGGKSQVQVTNNRQQRQEATKQL